LRSELLNWRKSLSEGQERQQIRTKPDLELEQIIEIRDPEIDVEQVMDRIRANVARRRAEGAYQEDLDAIASRVRSEVVPDSAVSDGEGGVLALTLSELESHWIIREQPFVSHVPVFGSLIVAVRNLWNWMSTKWYAQPLLQQQVGFNALVVRAFQELNVENRLLSENLQRLEEQVERLREENRALSTKTGPAQASGSSQKKPESSDKD
jgi:O-antigen chain-terminating methyltransferase